MARHRNNYRRARKRYYQENMGNAGPLAHELIGQMFDNGIPVPPPSESPARLRIGNHFALGYQDGAALVTPWPIFELFHKHKRKDGAPKPVPVARLARVSIGGELSEAEQAWWHMTGIATTDTAQAFTWISEGVAGNKVPEAERTLTPSEALKRPSLVPRIEPSAREALERLFGEQATWYLGTPEPARDVAQFPQLRRGAPMQRVTGENGKTEWHYYFQCRECGHARTMREEEVRTLAEKLYQAGKKQAFLPLDGD